MDPVKQVLLVFNFVIIMSFAIDVVDGHGLNNETHCQLQPKSHSYNSKRRILAIVHY